MVAIEPSLQYNHTMTNEREPSRSEISLPQITPRRLLDDAVDSMDPSEAYSPANVPSHSRGFHELDDQEVIEAPQISYPKEERKTIRDRVNGVLAWVVFRGIRY